MLGPGATRFGRDAGRARRWARLAVSPPRMRSGPERVGNRRVVRQALDAHRPGGTGRYQDVQITRQLDFCVRVGDSRGIDRRAFGPARRALPTRLGVARGTVDAGSVPARHLAYDLDGLTIVRR